MSHSIKCFACKTRIYLPLSEQIQQLNIKVICPHCNYQYLASYYVNEQCQSKLISTEKSKGKHKSKTICQRVYNLRVKSERDRSKFFEFSSEGEIEKFSALPNDRLLIIEAVERDWLRQRRKLDCQPKLIWISNLTTENSYQIFFPRGQALAKGWRATWITLIATSVTFGAVSLTHSSLPIVSIIYAVIPISFGVGIGVNRLHTSKYKQLAQNEISRLRSEQQYLKQLNLLKERFEKLQSESIKEHNIIERLIDLKEKMIKVNSEVYQSKIGLIERGINALDRKLKVSESLLEGYNQLLTMYQIEYDSSVLTEAFPDLRNSEHSLLDKLKELESLEEEKEELSIVLQGINGINWKSLA
jgi:DNA-directed RNA polymerase subunit RPC12/RpoP